MNCAKSSKEQLETLVKNSGKAIKQEKDRQAAITKRSKEIDQAKAKLMKGIEEAEEEFPENVSDFNKALSDLNKEKRQLEQQREDIDAESSELMAFLALAFVIALTGAAEPVLEQVVGLEPGEGAGALTPAVAQYLRHRQPGIVVEDALGHSAQKGEG